MRQIPSSTRAFPVSPRLLKLTPLGCCRIQPKAQRVPVEKSWPRGIGCARPLIAVAIPRFANGDYIVMILPLERRLIRRSFIEIATFRSFRRRGEVRYAVPHAPYFSLVGFRPPRRGFSASVTSTIKNFPSDLPPPTFKNPL